MYGICRSGLSSLFQKTGSIYLWKPWQPKQICRRYSLSKLYFTRCTYCFKQETTHKKPRQLVYLELLMWDTCSLHNLPPVCRNVTYEPHLHYRMNTKLPSGACLFIIWFFIYGINEYSSWDGNAEVSNVCTNLVIFSVSWSVMNNSKYFFFVYDT